MKFEMRLAGIVVGMIFIPLCVAAAVVALLTRGGTSSQPGSIDEPDLLLIFQDGFDTRQPDWTLSDGWTYGTEATEPEAHVLSSTTEGASAWLVDASAFGTAVQVRARIESGALQLHVRRTETSGYTAALHADGQIRLYRGRGLLQATTLTNHAANGWHTLRFSAIGSTLRVSVDGQEIIVMVDPADSPLPAGGAGVSIAGSPAAIALDDFKLWIPDTR